MLVLVLECREKIEDEDEIDDEDEWTPGFVRGFSLSPVKQSRLSPLPKLLEVQDPEFSDLCQ